MQPYPLPDPIAGTGTGTSDCNGRARGPGDRAELQDRTQHAAACIDREPSSTIDKGGGGRVLTERGIFRRRRALKRYFAADEREARRRWRLGGQTISFLQIFDLPVPGGAARSGTSWMAIRTRSSGIHADLVLV